MSLWKDVYRERCEKDAIVRMLLEEIVEDSRNRMRHMDGIADVGMIHARDVLENIIAGRNGEQKDLSRTYYARKTLRRLQRGWVLDQWRAYRSNQQSFPIWQGCGLMAMFSDHEMELSDLDRQFESLAQEFLAISPLEDSQDHGFSASSTPSVYSSAGSPSLGRGYDSPSAGHIRNYGSQVDRLKDLIRFFTLEKGFKGNTENYYDPLNSFIDKVLVRKVGIPISLCVVFAELAQRVGIAGVELMGFPQHFMIRYRPREPRDAYRSSPVDGTADPSPTPETYYLDLFHPPYRLLSTDEYEDYFSSLSIPQPPSVYRDLPTPPLEIFLRCLRNIILAVEQTGGAGRIGSDHQTSLYSGITQLLALHPSEEWGLYVLWLKYLSNFWPEDIGFVRIAIEDMELTDHRRSVSRSYGAPSLPHHHGQPRPHHVYAHGRGGFANMGAGLFTSSTQETIKILRAQVRELEMADEVGDVGHIRRRRRPKAASPTSASPTLSGTSWMASRSRAAENVDHEEVADPLSNATSPTVSSPTIDSQLFHAHHQSLRHNSVAGEQQSRSMDGMATSLHEEGTVRPSVVMNTFGGEERRRPEPEYYVGEVFRHLIYRYTGVIYGYDLKCEAEEGWIRSMGIDSLTYGRHQPFYNALLSDGSRRYVAQENIQVMFRDHRRPPSVSLSQSEYPSVGRPHDSQQASLEADAIHAATDDIVDAETSTGQAGASAGPETLAAAAAAAVASEFPVATAATSTILSATSFTLFNLQFSELGPLGIEAVGQYFESWDGDRGHYVMNKELRKVYPTEDYQ
ncbi:hypothetical protein BGZ72_001303 [Mortierella alpina]|nr:hypothetical protein BGZ72_001303 [Mortierella alpina]